MAPAKKISPKQRSPIKPRPRGRPPKRKDGNRGPTPPQKASMSNEKPNLRRRDAIKTTERYSPELHEPTRRSRGRGGAITFPSTTSTDSKYISLDSDDELGSASGSKRKRSEPTTKKEVKSYLVDVKKDDETNKMLITLPDGTTHILDATPGIYNANKRSTKKTDEDEDWEEDIFEDDGAVDDDDDEDFKPSSGSRPKRMLPRSAKKDTEGSEGNRAPRRPSIVSGIKMSRLSRTGDSPAGTPKLLISPKLVTPDGSKTTKISSTGSANRNKVSFLTTPKSVSISAAITSLRQPPKRNYGSAAKFIDELPELSECTSEEQDTNLSKLPDKVVFINSDLPLQHSIASTGEKKMFLFRQIISPVMSNYPCLLCPGTKFIYKEEKDLIVHYSTYHELNIEHHTAKFSEEIVFVCLPKSIIAQMKELDNASVIINAPCQYCGDVVKLETVEDMKNHYSNGHGKQIQYVEQEEILNMHKLLHCSQCDSQSQDFALHHKHMKTEHKLHTFVCKCCAFQTQDPSRLRTHFRAKHMISNTRMQNLQCTYCSGLIFGIERMNKHIMVTHCVQTAPNEFSCTACLQPCGKADELLSHSYRCQSLAAGGGMPKETEETKILSGLSHPGKQDTKCFLCDKVFDTPKKCDLHLNHVHTKWVVRNVIHDTFLMVKHPNGKTDLMPSNSPGGDSDLLKLNDLPSTKELEEIGTKANYGHYCFKCETVIKIYPLYYLHMYNVHKMEKIFECKVSSCKQTFREAKGLEDHIKATKHPQKSVIEDPLGAIACHFCNVYFADDKELQKHHLSEDHFNKITMMMDRSGSKPEPRNHKCKTCHSWFGLLDSFIYHLENESHKHECAHCGLHFALPSSRRSHIQGHHGENADICEICSVRQGTKERLFAHLVEHNIVFECNRCMRKFYQREQLNAHMDTHGDPVHCPWDGCVKEITRQNLTTHIRQHRIENESKCKICGKGFSSKQVLQTHMEIHAKAESNAKAILQAVPNTTQAVTSNNANSNLSASGTTLISITTPSPNLTSIKQRISPTKGKNKPPRSLPKTRNSSVDPAGLKIMCCSCNQLFSSHNELSSHKCVVPVVTITGGKSEQNEIQIDPSALNNLISSPIVFTQSDQFQLPIETTNSSLKDETLGENLEEDPQKLVLDMAEQLSQVVQEEEAEKLKQKQLKKVEQLIYSQNQSHQKQNDQKKQVSLPESNIQARARKTYSSLRSNQSNDVNSLSQIGVSSDQSHNSTNSRKSEENHISNENSTIKLEQAITVSDLSTSNDQIIVLQQPDGQMFQICVPEGMDINEAIRSLNLAVSDNVSDNVQQSELMYSTQNITSTPDPLEQSMQEITGQNAAIESADGQQVFYLPVNEDGTCPIDATTLALLAGNGEVPIIVSSNN